MGTRLRALVLGAAAGGGLPQWNCGCRNCSRARINGSGNGPRDGSGGSSGDGSGIAPQTQSSLAVSGNGTEWAILNASPDIRQQLAANPVLHPKELRHTPITSVLLTNGDIDHIAGLLILREKQRFRVFVTEAIANIIESNSIFDALDRSVVEFVKVGLDEAFELAPSLTATLFSVPGKVPLYMEEEVVDTQLEGDQTVGVQLVSSGQTAFYIPGCARMTVDLESRLSNAKLVFFDGTVFENEEMIATGTGQKTGSRMGHMSMAGPGGSIEAFENLNVKRKIFIHINNTNPVWDPQSTERSLIERSGWEIGYDGLEAVL